MLCFINVKHSEAAIIENVLMTTVMNNLINSQNNGGNSIRIFFNYEFYLINICGYYFTECFMGIEYSEEWYN